MALRANSRMVIPMIALEDATPATMTALLEQVPAYEPREFRRLVENTVGAVHQLPLIFYRAGRRRIDLKDIEAYFGRSSAGSETPGQNIYGRFRAHRERGHKYGLVFARTTIKDTLCYERWGITLINYLKKVGGLCIANSSRTCVGGVGSTEPGLLYLTFRTMSDETEHAETLTLKEIERGVEEIMSEIAPELSKRPKSVWAGATQHALSMANEPTFTGAAQVKPFAT
jgi:hypothetical protein